MIDTYTKIYEKKLSDLTIEKNAKIALYGTGDGAEVIYQIMCKNGYEEQIIEVVDADDSPNIGNLFHGHEINSITNVCDKIDVIIICALIYHRLIESRVRDYIEKNHKDVFVINPFGHNTVKQIEEYVHYLENGINTKDDLYKAYTQSSIELNSNDTRIIAWYLPQYHKTKTNDKYHGKGFTDWVNTSKALPMFVNHYQPHIPYDVGYYDLNDPDVFVRQIELAKHYGVYGFSFYYYWFSGKRELEKPLEYFLAHKELDFKYCITWANENWSTLWDGGKKEVILEQNLKEEDDVKFISDLIPYLEDERYITVGDKPLLILYRPNLWTKERVNILFGNIRKECKKIINKELYIVVCNTFGFEEEASDWGADAVAEFPPHNFPRFIKNTRIDGYLNPNFVGYIRDASDFIKEKEYLQKIRSKDYFRAAVPSWDNSSRKAYGGANIFIGFNPQTFQQWLVDIMLESKKIHNKDEDIVFVNAWNEWAEGAHLEPDMKYGYANLEAVKKAIEIVRDRK